MKRFKRTYVNVFTTHVIVHVNERFCNLHLQDREQSNSTSHKQFGFVDVIVAVVFASIEVRDMDKESVKNLRTWRVLPLVESLFYLQYRICNYLIYSCCYITIKVSNRISKSVGKLLINNLKRSFLLLCHGPTNPLCFYLGCVGRKFFKGFYILNDTISSLIS